MLTAAQPLMTFGACVPRFNSSHSLAQRIPAATASRCRSSGPTEAGIRSGGRSANRS